MHSDHRRPCAYARLKMCACAGSLRPEFNVVGLKGSGGNPTFLRQNLLRVMQDSSSFPENCQRRRGGRLSGFSPQPPVKAAARTWGGGGDREKGGALQPLQDHPAHLLILLGSSSLGSAASWPHGGIQEISSFRPHQEERPTKPPSLESGCAAPRPPARHPCLLRWAADFPASGDPTAGASSWGASACRTVPLCSVARARPPVPSAGALQGWLQLGGKDFSLGGEGRLGGWLGADPATSWRSGSSG